MSDTFSFPISRTRYRIFDNAYPHFLTCTCVAWLPVFSQPDFAKIIFNSWTFLQRNRNIDILAYVILENHLHWIAVGPELSRCVGNFKSYTARQIIDEMKRRNYATMLQELEFYKARHKQDQEYQLWQEGSHPKQISSDEVMWQKIEYIHNNPLRRGYVDDPVAWRYSSARNYAKLPELMDVVTEW